MTINISHPAPANERGWGPGWPNCQTSKWVSLVVAGVPFPGGVREEVRELYGLLIGECVRRGYKLMDPGCWGAACRDIKRPDGSTTGTPSNHSWGLAVDINAPKNPNTTGPLVTDMPKWMPELFNEYGFRWGGDYRKLGGSTVDAMHYEFCGTPTDARAMTEKARRAFSAPAGEDDDVKFDEFKDGASKYIRRFREKGGDPGPAPDAMSGAQKFGYDFARFAAQNPKEVAK